MGFEWDTNEMSVLIAAKLGGPLRGTTARIIINSIHVKGDVCFHDLSFDYMHSNHSLKDQSVVQYIRVFFPICQYQLPSKSYEFITRPFQCFLSRLTLDLQTEKLNHILGGF